MSLLLTAAIALTSVLAPQSAVPDNNLNSMAPLARIVDGVRGVPIDIQSVSASLNFDMKARTKQVSAQMVFQTLETGFPIFDLRQEILSATLDMKPIAVEKLAAHDFGPASGTMRIIEREVRTGANSILHLDYELNKPLAPASKGALKRDNGLFFSNNFTDLKPGRYLEQWFPANLIYDQFEFTLDLQLNKAANAHRIVTNATVKKKGRHHWLLTWPMHTTAFSPMLVIVPEDDVEYEARNLRLKNGQKIKVEITKEKTCHGEIDKAFQLVEKALEDFSKSMGEWPHGKRYVLYIRDSMGSMEYDGGTCTAMGAIRHETFHSWFGRGVKPASQNDAWWDEAWDVWFADAGRYANRQYSTEDKAITLCSSNPWNRITSAYSYGKGAQVFARLAMVLGEDELIEYMSSFFKKYSLKTCTTNDLNNHLTKESGNAQVDLIFNRFVFGKQKEKE